LGRLSKGACDERDIVTWAVDLGHYASYIMRLRPSLPVNPVCT
jgi:hypothetical protein